MTRTHRSPVGVLALRVAVAVAVAGTLAAVAAATTGYLAALAVVGVALSAAGVAESTAVAGFALAGVASAGAAAVGVVAVARRVDRAVVAAATPPSPVERARRAYVRDDIGEREFERRVESALAAERHRERERRR